MNHKERIELNDSMLDIIVKLSEGNPGAAVVCTQLFKRSADIDPDSAFGPYTGLIGLDTCGIYGSKIWMFYKDVCGEDITIMLMLLRAVQLGFTSEENLKNAIENHGQGIDIEALRKQVKEILPDMKV